MKRTLQVANIIGLIATIIMNYLSNALPLNGKTPGQLSDQYPNLFVPAGFTFSIWGVIYLFLIGFIIYQASDLFSKEKKELPFVERIGWWFVISCVANIAWLFAWHYEIVSLSLILMVGILFSLIQIYLRLRIGEESYKGIDLWLVRVPFSIYLGWISVATIANTTALLVKSGYAALNTTDLIWTIVMIAIAVVLGLTMLLRKRDFPYVLVLIWALYGIMSANQVNAFDVSPQVVTTTIVAMSVLALGSLITLFRPAK